MKNSLIRVSSTKHFLEVLFLIILIKEVAIRIFFNDGTMQGGINKINGIGVKALILASHYKLMFPGIIMPGIRDSMTMNGGMKRNGLCTGLPVIFLYIPELLYDHLGHFLP